MSDIVERLRAPAYWFSGSSEGHEGENSAPYEAADEIERLRAVVQSLADAMNILSSRPGITITEVANMLNEVGDAARVALEGK